jgi:hypothetical protein
MSYLTKPVYLVCLLTFVLADACSRNPPQDTCSANLSCSSSPPNRDKALAHIQQHVTYPATRAQILAVCAQTKEFAEGEKQWVADNLPEGTYANADSVIRVLKL